MAISLSNITKTYGDKLVLDHFSAEIPEGRTTCILGPSGCGKTTLLHILLGILPFDEGEITGLEGRRVSAIFQEDRLCENLSVLRNLLLVMKEAPAKEILQAELAAVGLEGEEHTPAGDLSGGMKRRVAILRALLVDPDVIILDEPFAALDEERKHAVIAYVREKTAGKTLILVTHDPEEAQLLGADILQM